MFQSTLPRGERHQIKSLLIMLNMFQSTLPRGERRGVRPHRLGIQSFQSTLPRGERRRKYAKYHITKIVSIHAPARGATSTMLSGHVRRCSFQSTLPRGSDFYVIYFGRYEEMFQSTLPRGERRCNHIQPT